MRYVLLLVTLWLSVSGCTESAQQAPPSKGRASDIRAAPNGQIVNNCFPGELPSGMRCTLYLGGEDGSATLIDIEDPSQVNLLPQDLLIRRAVSSCEITSTPNRLVVSMGERTIRLDITPPNCAEREWMVLE